MSASQAVDRIWQAFQHTPEVPELRLAGSMDG